jgi:ATP-dependent Clp protease protease subunit
MIQLPQPKERNLFLAQQVDQKSINDISKAIIEINENDNYLSALYALHSLTYNPKPINLYIDSYGGYVYQCLGLLGIMKASNVPVHTIVTGCAMSCGFLISICGHKRFGYKNSTYLYHQVSGGAIGKAKDMEEDVIEVKRLQKNIEKITLENTNISKSQLKSAYDAKHDWIMNSRQASDLGVIDEILISHPKNYEVTEK